MADDKSQESINGKSSVNPQEGSKEPIGSQRDDVSFDASGDSPDAHSPERSRRTRLPPTIDLEASRRETFDAAHAEASRDSDNSTEHDESAAETPRVETVSPARSSSVSSLLASALAGAAAAVVIGLAAWFAGARGSSHGLDVSTIATIETIAARVARLEESPSAPPVKPDAALNARLDALEKSTDKSLKSFREALADVRTQNDSTTKTIDEIKSAAPAAPSGASPDLSAIENRIASFEAKAQAVATQSAQANDQRTRTSAADDIKLKRAVAASSLDLAVRQSEPFAPFLMAAKQLTDDASVLKPLEGFASTGVPGAAALSRDLLALLAQRDSKAAGESSGAGWMDRLRASAMRLVRIRRTDAVAGSDVDSVMSRVAAAARRNDIAEARREISALPPAERSSLQSWIDKAEARDAALAVSRQFAETAMTALSKSSP